MQPRAFIQMRRRRRIAASWQSVLLLTVQLAACGPNWQPVSLVEPRSLDKKTVLEFHAHEKIVRLHGVQFSHDSVSGIPWLDHLSCDTCRVSFALSEVSGSRTGKPGAGGWYILTPFVVIMGAFIMIALGGYGSD